MDRFHVAIKPADGRPPRHTYLPTIACDGAGYYHYPFLLRAPPNRVVARKPGEWQWVEEAITMYAGPDSLPGFWEGLPDGRRKVFDFGSVKIRRADPLSDGKVKKQIEKIQQE